jgi:hypothetical protein
MVSLLVIFSPTKVMVLKQGYIYSMVDTEGDEDDYWVEHVNPGGQSGTLRFDFYDRTHFAALVPDKSVEEEPEYQQYIGRPIRISFLQTGCITQG